MAEQLNIPHTGVKKDIYEAILPQIEALVSGEKDLIANMANVSAVLKEAFHFLWVGFYLVKEEQLVLGPFQGPVACTRIQYGRGVCGTAWKQQAAIVVPDVDAFPGHIACSSRSRSEIVIPMIADNKVFAVLDIDSELLNRFDKEDLNYLTQICNMIN
ncbi:GAF domain-containing protein [Parabacteroides sp. FAFU027]|uniref:GAF domain-containing protein n=1 Tax=Parabacteroides sp. FAFU027 TaxID=2922715 RepID=UPI001FAF4AE9|nr:GAF domain-containing protein [Parabacteroides sp. FAFU027]